MKKNIVVTGAAGFIGKNLVVRLAQKNDFNIMQYHVEDSFETLEKLIQEADFLFHLAGVNRPEQERDFKTGNKDFTEQVLKLLRKHHKKIPLVLASSIQAAYGNPYGKSKKEAEDLVFDWVRESGGIGYVYRLPNIFGKWCRPNYNSVVATFCHNIAHNLPIQMNDPSAELTLAYIDDVMEEFLAVLGGRAHWGNDGFCLIPRVFKITLQQLAEILYSFKEIRKTDLLPDMNHPLHRFMYTTYLSYLSDDDLAYGTDMKTDHRGWLYEVLKSPHIGQIFISVTKPGMTRGNHYHHTKVEKFVVVQGKAMIRLRRIDGNQILEYPVSGERIQIVDIPPGYTHKITNEGDTDVVTLFWASELFQPENPDTFYLEV